MSYQEKNITVYLMSTLLVFGFYCVRVLQMQQGEGFTENNVYALWMTVITLGIVVNVLATVVTQIVFGMIRNNSDDPLIEDERDKMINLKAIRNSYVVLGFGLFVSMGSQLFDVSSLIMFSLLLFFAMIAEIIGGLSRMYFYRRGF